MDMDVIEKRVAGLLSFKDEAQNVLAVIGSGLTQILSKSDEVLTFKRDIEAKLPDFEKAFDDVKALISDLSSLRDEFQTLIQQAKAPADVTEAAKSQTASTTASSAAGDGKSAEQQESDDKQQA